MATISNLRENLYLEWEIICQHSHTSVSVIKILFFWEHTSVLGIAIGDEIVTYYIPNKNAVKKRGYTTVINSHTAPTEKL